MRIEIMLDKNPKISQSVMDAFHEEVSKRVCALFPETTIRIRQGYFTKIELFGVSLDED